MSPWTTREQRSATRSIDACRCQSRRVSPCAIQPFLPDQPGVLGGALTMQRGRTTIETMEVRIFATPEQEAFIREGIASGRFATAEDAAREALRLWEERQRRRTELLIELDAAEASFARGESRRVGPESITEFIAGVKRRGSARLNNPR